MQMATKLSRVTDSILHKIESGSLREGDQLPSEDDLAESHGVSVGTIQKALARLASTGLISRQHGRGTFVSGHSVAPADVRYLRFRDATGSDLPSYVHLRQVRRVKRAGPWSDFLGDERLVRIERLINIGGRFDLYSEFWLREEDFARLGGVNRRELENNLRELLGRQLAMPTLRVDQAISFEPLPARVAQLLGVKEGGPGFAMELRGYTLRERPLHYQNVLAAPFPARLVIVR